jgi:hypothetical protein
MIITVQLQYSKYSIAPQLDPYEIATTLQVDIRDTITTRRLAAVQKHENLTI